MTMDEAAETADFIRRPRHAATDNTVWLDVRRMDYYLYKGIINWDDLNATDWVAKEESGAV